ncbi:hypothetical protein [Actinomyces sp. W5033]|uniref:hypothetical protein n=1 Tax=Actinomyces sp. W5033 TaxID=3446479 RepID=UPI003EDF7CEB
MTAAAYLLTVVLLGFAAALLRLPPLVGYIAAGFVLGATGVPELPWVSTVGDLGPRSCCSPSGWILIPVPCHGGWS